MNKSAHIVLEDDGHCFVCGMNNQYGLKLSWELNRNTTTARFTAEKRFQGYANILHGGITAALLDEAMTRLVWQKYGNAVSAEMSIRYIKPIYIGDTLEIMGEIIDKKKNLVYTRGIIKTKSEEIAAKATGRSIIID
ncbi:MAG: PaaI family thioesterase [bacterium]